MTVPSWVGKVEELDATAFNRLARSSNVPILLYIGAPWCPPCTTMEPAVEKAAEDFVTAKELQAYKPEIKASHILVKDQKTADRFKKYPIDGVVTDNPLFFQKEK